MVREIVFHLGDHKTGSTSIQEVLRRKIWHPSGPPGAAPSLFYPPNMSQKALANALIERKAGEHDLDKRWSNTARKLDEADADIAVLSSEVFESVEPEALKAAIARYLPDHAASVRLIAYVRPHAERIVSSHAQVVKIGNYSGTLDEFHQRTLRGARFHYAPRFQKWREVFGGAFTLRPMIRAGLKGQDVVRDFLDFTLKGAEVTIEDLPRSNETLSIADLALMRFFHRSCPEEAHRALKESYGRAGWHFSRQLGAMVSPRAPDRPRLHQSLATLLVEDYMADAAELDAAFFSDTPMQDALRAAPTLAIETAQSIEIEDHFDAECCKLIAMWSSLTGDLLARQPRDWGPYFGKLWAAELGVASDPQENADDDEAPERRRGNGQRKNGARNSEGRKSGGRKSAGRESGGADLQVAGSGEPRADGNRNKGVRLGKYRKLAESGPGDPEAGLHTLGKRGPGRGPGRNGKRPA